MKPLAFLFVGPLKYYRAVESVKVAKKMIEKVNEGEEGPKGGIPWAKTFSTSL